MHLIFNNTIEQNNLKIYQYKKGDVLFHEGEICETIYLLVSGEMIIRTITSEGKEYIINILNKDDIFGDSLIFSNQNIFLGDGVFQEDSEIIKLTKKQFLELLQKEQILINYLHYISQRNTKTRNQIKILNIVNYKDRIMFYLENIAKHSNNNIIPIKSKEILAKELNMPRPSLSRELIILKQEGKIDYGKNFIKLLWLPILIMSIII